MLKDWQNSQALSQAPLAGNPTAARNNNCCAPWHIPPWKLLPQQLRHILPVWRLPLSHSPFTVCHAPLGTLSLRVPAIYTVLCTENPPVAQMPTCHCKYPLCPKKSKGRRKHKVGMSRMQKLTLKNALESILWRTE